MPLRHRHLNAADPDQSATMKIIHLLFLAPVALLSTAAGLRADAKYEIPAPAGQEHRSHAAELTAAQKKFLSGYENVRTALAVDDLAAVKTVAAAIEESAIAVGLTKVQTLDQARSAFTKVSQQALPLAAGRPGYFIVSCPMAGSDWVQTSSKISNPYLGKKMPTCGTVKN